MLDKLLEDFTGKVGEWLQTNVCGRCKEVVTQSDIQKKLCPHCRYNAHDGFYLDYLIRRRRAVWHGAWAFQFSWEEKFFRPDYKRPIRQTNPVNTPFRFRDNNLDYNQLMFMNDGREKAWEGLTKEQSREVALGMPPNYVPPPYHIVHIANRYENDILLIDDKEKIICRSKDLKHLITLAQGMFRAQFES